MLRRVVCFFPSSNTQFPLTPPTCTKRVISLHSAFFRSRSRYWGRGTSPCAGRKSPDLLRNSTSYQVASSSITKLTTCGEIIFWFSFLPVNYFFGHCSSENPLICLFWRFFPVSGLFLLLSHQQIPFAEYAKSCANGGKSTRGRTHNSQDASPRNREID